MTVAHKIYVVVGSTGEYSDKREWPVLWRHTLAEAEAAIATLQSEADDYKRRSDKDYEWDLDHGEAHRAGMLDPQFSIDYTGTTYHVWTIKDDPRAEDK